MNTEVQFIIEYLLQQEVIDQIQKHKLLFIETQEYSYEHLINFPFWKLIKIFISILALNNCYLRLKE